MKLFQICYRLLIFSGDILSQQTRPGETVSDFKVITKCISYIKVYIHDFNGEASVEVTRFYRNKKRFGEDFSWAFQDSLSFLLACGKVFDMGKNASRKRLLGSYVETS